VGSALRGAASIAWAGQGCGASARAGGAPAPRGGLLQSEATRTDITTRRTRAGDATIRLHRSHSLIARDTDTRQGIPITSVARTLLDLAATIRPDRLERALAQAQRQQLYDHTAITELLARANGHRGERALAVATAREPKLTRSEWEIRLLKVVRDAALPEPLTNFSLTAPDHPRLEVDFCWPTYRLIVETDGWESHGTRAAFEADRGRDAVLQGDGLRVVRFTWRTPDDIIRKRLQALLTPAGTHPPHGSPVR
jgi:very-short-patch-repair endonuclease